MPGKTSLLRPTDIALPDLEQLDQFLEALNDAGKRQFLQELLTALSISKRDNNLEPLQETLSAWLHGRRNRGDAGARRQVAS